MKDWQFWIFVAYFWIILGIAAPFPIDMIFFIFALMFGAMSWFIQKHEQLQEFLDRRIRFMQFAVLHQDLEDIKKLLGKKRIKRR